MLFGALVLLAIGQAALLWTSRGAPVSGRFVAEGDDLSTVLATGEDGRARSLAAGEPTLLMVFHSQCGHCARIAPQWTTWLREHGDLGSVLAVSTEAVETGRSYADGYGWDVEVARVESERLGDAVHALTSRTPWLFLVEADGSVVLDGHGSDIDRVGTVWVGLLRREQAKP